MSLQEEIESIKEEVATTEEQREIDEANAFRFSQNDEYMSEVQRLWPEFANARMGFMEIPVQGFQITHFVIQRDLITAFIQDRIDAVSYRQQRDLLQQAGELSTQVIAYKDSIITLERENKVAYQTGYYDAFQKYEALNEKYVQLLENPQVKLGFQGWGSLVTSALVGAAIGVAATQ